MSVIAITSLVIMVVGTVISVVLDNLDMFLWTTMLPFAVTVFADIVLDIIEDYKE